VRTRAVVTSIFASIGVLVIGWQAGAAVTAGSVGTSTTTTPTTTTAGTSNGGTGADGTYTGTDVSTRYGSVQVEVTVSGGQVSDVTALQLTDTDRRSIQISNRAAPILKSEVLASQSADVSNVSGATYTSDAYLQSLQAALDQAGL